MKVKPTSDDCIMLMEAYKDLYGERMPYFEKIIDRLTYQWEKLIGFGTKEKNLNFKFFYR